MSIFEWASRVQVRPKGILVLEEATTSACWSRIWATISLTIEIDFKKIGSSNISPYFFNISHTFLSTNWSWLWHTHSFKCFLPLPDCRTSYNCNSSADSWSHFINRPHVLTAASFEFRGPNHWMWRWHFLTHFALSCTRGCGMCWILRWMSKQRRLDSVDMWRSHLKMQTTIHTAISVLLIRFTASSTPLAEKKCT